MGVGLAAAGDEVGASYRGVARELGGRRRGVACSARSARRAADVAALINGGLIHSLEYDDTHTGSIVHGSAVLAAVGACGRPNAGRVPGRRRSPPIARGWEMFVRLGLAAPGAFQREGFQITSVGGTMVAALVAADIAGLDEDAAVNAVGIALSQSSGVFEFLTNGSSVKSLHPGWAAHAGVLAARLAQAGMTGPETALEGRPRSVPPLRRATGCGGAASPSLIDDLGARWHLPDCALQASALLPLPAPVHRGARSRCASAGSKSDDVAELTCRIAARRGADRLPSVGGEAGRLRPPDALEPAGRGRCRAARRRGHARHVRARLAGRRARCSGAADRLAAAGTEPTFPHRFEAELSARRRDGSALEIRLDDVYGNASRPAAADDVLAEIPRQCRPGRSPDGRAVRWRTRLIDDRRIGRIRAADAAAGDEASSAVEERRCRGSIWSSATARAILPAHGDAQAVDIAVRDGRIAALLAPAPPPRRPRHSTRAGSTVMPGAIDVHLHLGHGKDICRPRVPEDAAQETARPRRAA